MSKNQQPKRIAQAQMPITRNDVLRVIELLEDISNKLEGIWDSVSDESTLCNVEQQIAEINDTLKRRLP